MCCVCVRACVCVCVQLWELIVVMCLVENGPEWEPDRKQFVLADRKFDCAKSSYCLSAAVLCMCAGWPGCAITHICSKPVTPVNILSPHCLSRKSLSFIVRKLC